MVETAIKKFVSNVSNLWGESSVQDEYDEENEYEYIDDGEYEEPETNIFGGFGKRKVVPMPQPQQIKMKISKPTNFDQVDEIIFQLKNKNAVVINLEYVSKDVARRIVDTVGGAVTALDGHMEKVSNSIFVVAPFNYDIVNEITKEKIEGKFSTSLFTK